MSKRILVILSVSLIAVGCAKPAAPPAVAPGVSKPAGDSTRDSRASTDSPSAAASPAAEQPPPADRTASEPSKTTATPSAPASPPTEKKEVGPSVADLIARARQAAAGGLQVGDFPQAIKLLEQCLEQDPKNRAALSLITECTQMQGIKLVTSAKEAEGMPLFMESAKYLRLLRKTGEPLNERETGLAGVVYYNEACAYARGDQLDKAIASLQESLDIGFADLNQLDTDSDMDPLREREDFKKLRERLVEKPKKANP